MNVLDRIDEYLQLGGLFNPELANHQAVSKLIIDCRDYIKEQHEINERCNQTIRELRLVNVFTSTMEDEMKQNTIRCVVDQPYVDRPLADRTFDWIVYNAHSGYVVALTYSEEMAKTILRGINSEPNFMDTYSVTKRWKSPEPMV